MGVRLGFGPRPGTRWREDSELWAAGDWCVGGRVEGALVSGIEIADRVIASA